MLIITQTGRILYISENAAEYLGHSMVIIIGQASAREDKYWTDCCRRTCWSTATASMTSSTSRTIPQCRRSCWGARSWQAQRKWVPVSLRIGSSFVGWMCQETPAGRCASGTKRCEERFKSSNCVSSGDPRGRSLLRNPPQCESQRAGVCGLVYTCCYAGDTGVRCTGHLLPNTDSSLPSHVVFQGATNIFTSVHSMDLKISQIDSK